MAGTKAPTASAAVGATQPQERMGALVGRSVLAYFARREQAELACSLLRQEGYDTVQLDEVALPGETGDRAAGPHPGGIDGLAEWGASDEHDAGGPLIGAEEDSQSFVPGDVAGPGETGPSWVVTVVTGEDGVNRAVQILEDAGGAV